jgi:PIN domain nuclease of toxin-antitoxin system
MNSSLTDDERPNESSFVLDASALLALMLDEPGRDRVEAALTAGAIISAVNFAEVVSRLVDYGLSDERVAHDIEQLDLDIVSLDAETAWAAGLLRRPTRTIGLSLGDRACLALGAATGLAVLTADRTWSGLGLDLEVSLIR